MIDIQQTIERLQFWDRYWGVEREYPLADEKNDTDGTPEEVTMKDLWRVMSGVNSKLTALDTKIDSVKDELKADIEATRHELKGETQGIREVVDTLASQEDFAQLDRKISAVSADTQATRQATQDVKAEVSRLRADVKSAGIAVR